MVAVVEATCFKTEDMWHGVLQVGNHHVEVHLLWVAGIGLLRGLVVGSAREGEPGRGVIFGNDHTVMRPVRHRQPDQFEVG